MKIGILPSFCENDRPFLNTFSFVNNYAYRIYKNGGIPYGILFPNGNFDENMLSEYDGFLIPGGSTIHLYHVLTIHFSILNNKPILGICMGMQVIGLYSYIIHILKKNKMNITYENIAMVFNETDEDDYLLKIKGHNKENPFYMKKIKMASHKVYLISKTFKQIYKDIIIEPSLHEWAIKKTYGNFIVSGYSGDGVIEAIEYVGKPFILGVQFHIELEDKNDKLFKYFLEACRYF